MRNFNTNTFTIDEHDAILYALQNNKQINNTLKIKIYKEAIKHIPHIIYMCNSIKQVFYNINKEFINYPSEQLFALLPEFTHKNFVHFCQINNINNFNNLQYQYVKEQYSGEWYPRSYRFEAVKVRTKFITYLIKELQ